MNIGQGPWEQILGNETILGGVVFLEKMWELGSGHMGMKANPNGTFSLTAARSEFLPPESWKRVLIPYKARIVGGSTFVCGLHRPGFMASLTLTKGGLMNVDLYNSTEEIIYLIPKTILASILGADVFIKEFGKKAIRLFPESRSY